LGEEVEKEQFCAPGVTPPPIFVLENGGRQEGGQFCLAAKVRQVLEKGAIE